MTTQSDDAQSGSERSPRWRNVIGAALLFALLLSIALGVKLNSVWPVVIAVPACAICQYLFAHRAPLVTVSSKQAFERKIVGYVFLGLLLLLLLVVVLKG